MTSYRSLARNHDFTVLWTGQTISELGSSVSTFAFPLVAYAVSGSAVVTSLTEAAYLLGMLSALLPAGLLADRLDRRLLMRTSAAGGVLLYLTLVAAGLAHALTVPHLVVVALGTGIAAGLFSPAESAAVRAVVSDEELPTALSQNQARQHIASLLGAPLGGVLFAVARWVPFAADTVSYAACWLLLGRVRSSLGPEDRPAAEAPPTTRAAAAEIGAGLRFLFRHPFYRVLATWAPLANLTINAVFFVAVLRLIAGGYPAWQIGLVETVAGASGLLGALCAPWIIDRIRTGALMITTAWVFVPLLVPMAVWNTPWIVGGAVTLGLFVNPASNAGISAYAQAILPRHLLGRYSSTMQFTSMSVMPLAPVLAGALLSAIGGEEAVLALAVPVALTALVPTLSRTIWRVPRPSAWRASPTATPEPSEEPAPAAPFPTGP